MRSKIRFIIVLHEFLPKTIHLPKFAAMKNLALHILDIVHNSIRAEASLVDIYLYQSQKKNTVELVIKDDGKGMSQEMLDKVTDPYTTSRKERKVGLGISLLKQNAEQANGNFTISSGEGRGTMINASFQLDHLDTPPPGDVIDTIVTLTTGNPKVDFIYSHITDQGEYIFDSRKVKEALDDVPIYDSQVANFLRDMLTENIEENCGPESL